MRQYAWYSPEFDCVVLQTFMDECYISFEWGNEDFFKVGEFLGFSCQDPMNHFLWLPLGEL